MMKWVFALMLIISAICGALSGNIEAVTGAAIGGGAEAIELFLYILGGMCMWGGLMRISEKAGITELLSKGFKPFLKRLFKGLDCNGKAFQAICMNITANMLGLGNAATPLGLEAMRQLELAEEKELHEKNVPEKNKKERRASRNMILFVIFNTASITLIPTTAATFRLKHGSAAPLEILPSVLITSACALAAGLIAAVALNRE